MCFGWLMVQVDGYFGWIDVGCLCDVQLLLFDEFYLCCWIEVIEIVLCDDGVGFGFWFVQDC